MGRIGILEAQTTDRFATCIGFWFKITQFACFPVSWILLSIHISNILRCSTDSLMSLSIWNMMRLPATNWNSIFSESSEVSLESTQVSGKKVKVVEVQFMVLYVRFSIFISISHQSLLWNKQSERRENEISWFCDSLRKTVNSLEKSYNKTFD